MEIRARKLSMNDALIGELITISEWGLVNRVDFNARKTQRCFLTHRRDAGANVLSSVSMGNVNIEEADALDVLVLVGTITFFEWRRKHLSALVF